jgi:hypothetical protein
MLELLDTRPACDVQEPEYHRLLGYPPGLMPGERARELSAWARQWYAEHGRPWIYAREAALELTPDALRLDGAPFRSRKLHDHLQRAQAKRAMLVAVGAGRACEEHAQELWQQERPDEYFFLEVFGSAVVEHLVASVSGRLCDLAARDDLIAVSHYSPGYAGWDIAEQALLFELITRRESSTLPEPVEVLTSGMLRPKKTQLTVFGLTARTDAAVRSLRLVPCDRCSFSPCQYRRRPYRHAIGARASSTADPAMASSGVSS